MADILVLSFPHLLYPSFYCSCGSICNGTPLYWQVYLAYLNQSYPEAFPVLDTPGSSIPTCFVLVIRTRTIILLSIWILHFLWKPYVRLTNSRNGSGRETTG